MESLPSQLPTQSITSAIVTINETGLIQSVDRRTCTMFGYQPDELHGKKIDVLIPSPYKEQHDTYLENYKRTGVKKIIGKSRLVEGQHKDGSIFPIMISVTEVKVMGIRMFIGAVEKVPEKSMILVADIAGKILSCTRTCEEVLGYTVPELIGQSINILMPAPHNAMHDNYIQQNYVSGGILRMLGHTRNLPVRHKNGVVFPISILVNKVSTGGVVAFRAAIEVPPKETFFTIDQDGCIISCNFTFVRPMFGHTHVSLLGKNISILIPELQLKEEEEASNSKKRKNVSGHVIESLVDQGVKTVTAYHQDGSEFLVNLEILKLVPDERGQQLYSVQIKRVTSDNNDNNANADSTHSSDDLEATSRETVGDYYVTKFLGRGTYGVVKLGVHKTTGAKVAVKIMFKNHLDATGHQRIMRETKILQQLDHPNIAKLINVIEKDDALFLLMEYCDGGDLLKYMRSAGGEISLSSASSSEFGDEIVGPSLAEGKTKRVFAQLASAISYLHSLNIVHRDLKHKNILFDSNGNVKLIDFGLSNWICQGNMSFCGTPAYCSPEMLLGTQYSGPEVDVWSMGIILYSLVTGKLPFMSVVDIIQQNYTVPPDVPAECADLIRQCLVVDNSKRATISSIVSHPWISPFVTLLPKPTIKNTYSSSLATTSGPLTSSQLPLSLPSLPSSSSHDSFFNKSLPSPSPLPSPPTIPNMLKTSSDGSLPNLESSSSGITLRSVISPAASVKSLQSPSNRPTPSTTIDNNKTTTGDGSQTNEEV
jgi:PAS domain S-box-containing protein